MTNEKNFSAEPILLGVLHGAYGLKGWVRVQPFQDTQALLSSENWLICDREGNVRPIRMEKAKVHGAGLIAKLEGIETPEQAAELRGAVGMYRKDFPQVEEGEFYWVDLIGCEAVNKTGEAIGVVKGLIDNGVHDILDVKKPDGSSVLIPFVDYYFVEADLENRKIVLDWDPSWS